MTPPLTEIWLTSTQFSRLMDLNAIFDGLSTPEALLALRLILNEYEYGQYIEAVTTHRKLAVRIIGEQETMML